MLMLGLRKTLRLDSKGSWGRTDLMRLILRQTDSNLSQYQNFHQFTSTLGYRNSSHLPSDTGTVHIYPRIQEQLTSTLGYRNSSHLPSDTGTVYIYPRIQEQFTSTLCLQEHSENIVESYNYRSRIKQSSFQI